MCHFIWGTTASAYIIPETRKSACGIVYTVKKPRKVEEEETLPACKKAKTQAWELNQLSTRTSIPSLPSVETSSSLQLLPFLPYYFI